MDFATLKFNLHQRSLAGTLLLYFSEAHTRLCAQLVRVLICIKPTARRTIVFKNDRNTDFSGNTKALFDYLVANGYLEKYRIVWCVSQPGLYRGKTDRRVRFTVADGKNHFISLRSVYYGATSKYFFYTHDTGGINKNRCSDQIAVNLGHGNGLKAPKIDLMKRKDRNYLFDYLIVSGPFFVDAKAKYWQCDKSRILDLGFPRYDWLNKNVREERELLKELFGTPFSAQDSVILWLPTFFNNHEFIFSESSISLPLGFSGVKDWEELSDLNFFCETNRVKLIIKKHPAQAEWLPADRPLSHIFFLNDEMLAAKGGVLSDIMNASDALLTDFSSAAVDYLLLDRPIGFVLMDYVDYEKTRGFIIKNPLDYMPGEKLYSLQDIMRFISDVVQGKDDFREERAEMRKKMHNETTCYCERILNRLHLS